MFNLRPTSDSDKFGVEPKHLQCEGNLVDHALARRLFRGPQFKVALGPIGTVAVLVVDVLTRTEGTAKHFLHNETMLEGFLLTPDADSNVSRAVDMPIRVPRPPLTAFVSALLRAKLLRVVVSRYAARFEFERATRNDFFAQFTGQGGRLNNLGSTRALNGTKPLGLSALMRRVWLAAHNAIPLTIHRPPPLSYPALGITPEWGWTQ
jgi:hypothetical protein